VAWAAWISDPRHPSSITAKPGLVPGFVFSGVWLQTTRFRRSNVGREKQKAPI
jgi:hypothetical protein